MEGEETNIKTERDVNDPIVKRLPVYLSHQLAESL